MAFLQARFDGFNTVLAKSVEVVLPGKIRMAGTKNIKIAAESVAVDFSRVFLTPTMNIGALAEGFHYWINYCYWPKKGQIQKAFVRLTDPYSSFEEREFTPRESLGVFKIICDWQQMKFPTVSENLKRCEFLKNELDKLTH